jgi:hypothetical protein
MKRIYRYFAYSSILFILFSFVLFFLHNNNSNIYKLEKVLNYRSINLTHVVNYLDLIEAVYFKPIKYNQNNGMRILKDDGSLVAKLYRSSDLNKKFEILIDEFVNILRRGLDESQNNIINNTGVRFANAVKNLSTDYVSEKINIKINFYGLNGDSLGKDLEGIIANANVNFFDKLYDETLQHVDNTISNIEFYESMIQNDMDSISYSFQNENLNKLDSSSNFFVKENALYDIYVKQYKINLARKYAINTKKELNFFFNSLEEDKKKILFTYNNEKIFFDSKSKYDLRIYLIWVLLLAAILPIFSNVIFKQFRKIKF